MKRSLRPIAVLPTLFTLGNLVCGFFAIVVASRIGGPEDLDLPAPMLDRARDILGSLDQTHNLMLCGSLIVLAMVMDMFDGQVARMARVTSDFGGQLDSLCDVVSFGVAPAILLVKMCPQFTDIHREAIWMIAALFACCAAMRLARFNVETDAEDSHTEFSGLPTPAAAVVIASLAILTYTLRNEMNLDRFATFDWWFQRVLPLGAVGIALLMVSRVPYPHLAQTLLRGRRSFAQVVAIVFAITIIATVRWYAVPVLCVSYAALPPLRFALLSLRRTRTGDTPT